jgi:VWFA-related protein
MSLAPRLRTTPRPSRRTAHPLLLALLVPALAGRSPAQDGPPAPAPDDASARVEVRSTDERGFPDIAITFELRRPDGTAILDAQEADFAVAEDGRPVEILDFDAPAKLTIQPKTIVLVLDRSGSMEREGRLEALKEAVRSFLEVMPAGSRVAIVAFSGQVRLLAPFTDDVDLLGESVDSLRAGGETRFLDAVERGLELLEPEPGHRAVLALTDGLDTASRDASLESLVRRARNAGVPVHTLGLGSEEEIATDLLQALAEETRGQWFHAPRPEQLRSIFEELARRLGEGYTLTYRTDRRLPDGTLRPVTVAYRKSGQVGEAAVFIRGMVVPASGWSRLCLGLVGVLAALAWLPGRLARRGAPSGAPAR